MHNQQFTTKTTRLTEAQIIDLIARNKNVRFIVINERGRAAIIVVSHNIETNRTGSGMLGPGHFIDMRATGENGKTITRYACDPQSLHFMALEISEKFILDVTVNYNPVE